MVLPLPNEPFSYLNIELKASSATLRVEEEFQVKNMVIDDMVSRQCVHRSAPLQIDR